MRGWMLAVFSALITLLALPSTSLADHNYGSSLTGEPTVVKSNPVDTVYWLEKLPDGTSAAVTVIGTVKSVTIKGYAKSTEPAILRKIFIQVLRPQLDGSLLVVETSQGWELSTTPGTYTFEPTNMKVQPGDYIGIATVGGEFVFAAAAPGAVTNDFSGHEKDMNGDYIKPTVVEKDVELLTKIDVRSDREVEEEIQAQRHALEAKKLEEELKKFKEELEAKPCECRSTELFVDKTLLRKRRVPSNKTTFGVGFTWHLTCTQGRGGCVEFLTFKPPAIIVGAHKRKRPLKLKLDTFTFVCKSACNTSTFGRFEIKMKSRHQLNEIFGKTLAFEIDFTCGGFNWRYLTTVFVDQSGRMHAGRSRLLKHSPKT